LIIPMTGAGEWSRLPRLYLLAVLVLGLNQLRTLVSHRYCSSGETISHLEQFLDSANIKGSWLTEIVCPVGSRYHALHHLFPAIPYHNLPKAHRRLSTELEPDSIYHRCTYPSCRAVVADLINHVRGRNPAHDNKSTD